MMAGASAQGAHADVTPLVENERVRPEISGAVALKVSLPKGCTLQSNKPRDPLLIPTEITIERRLESRSRRFVWPPSTISIQRDRTSRSPSSNTSSRSAVPLKLARCVNRRSRRACVKLRYQACDANLCYPRRRRQAQWTIKVAPGLRVRGNTRTCSTESRSATASGFGRCRSYT